MYRITAWPKYKVNFWSITKCANTAMKIHLYELSHGNISLHRDTDINKHLKFISCEDAVANGYTNFTITRNPYTRFLSAYNYVRYKRPKKLKDIGLPKECNIDQLIKFLYDNRDNSGLDPHLKRQIDFVNYNVTTYLKTEQLINNWNLPFAPMYNLKNVNNKKEVMQLSTEQKHLVYNWYKEDFNFFGYEK